MYGAKQYLTEILLVIWLLVLYKAVREIWASRQGIAHRLKRSLKGTAVFLVSLLVLSKSQVALSNADAVLFALLAGAVVVAFSSKRPRRIPAKVRREVTPHYEAQTGAKYDPRKHHLDHIWPFVRGGSHTPRQSKGAE